MFVRSLVRGGERRLQPLLIGRVSPPISFHAALINDTGRQRKTSQFVVSRVLADVYLIWELLFVWCLQSGRCSPLFWDSDTQMQPGSHLMWPPLFLLSSPPSVSHTVSLPPPFSSFHIKDVWMSLADCASGLDTKCRGQLFALPTERGSVKILSSWKEPKLPTILQNRLHLCYRLWTFIVVMLFVLTHLTVICNSESLHLFKSSRIWLKWRFLDTHLWPGPVLHWGQPKQMFITMFKQCGFAQFERICAFKWSSSLLTTVSHSPTYTDGNADLLTRCHTQLPVPSAKLWDEIFPVDRDDDVTQCLSNLLTPIH